MTAPQHDLETLFDTACELAREERAAFLTSACANAPELRAEVEALLEVHDRGGAFLASPTGGSPVAPARSFDAEPPGTRIGAFTLVRLIAEGGFGSVFLAEQSHPVRRTVALKLLKPGMDSRTVATRFEAERQALALMDHPHIARVFDGGLTDPALGSRPYFVMEHVQGSPITAFAREHSLALDARLALFVQVCEAVQHAHTKGVIHRDLKPSNVLVSMTDGRPFAKVIDFGIAKATGAHLTDRAFITEDRQLIGTPEYMSPEQAIGSHDIDTRTDVYGLGVLLYELLTGATPFDGQRLRSAAYAELQRIIRDEDPPRPSTRVSRPGGTVVPPVRGVQPPADLRGELDWIVMKALDKDRARRYATPGDLAADIERYRHHGEVHAAPPTATYRLRKLVRRNKGMVTAAAAIALTLLLGAAGTGWGLYSALRENRRLTESNVLGRDYLRRIVAELEAPQAAPAAPAPPLTPVSLDTSGRYTDAWSTVGEAALEHIRTGRVLRAAAEQKSRELEVSNQALRERDAKVFEAISKLALRLGPQLMPGRAGPEARTPVGGFYIPGEHGGSIMANIMTKNGTLGVYFVRRTADGKRRDIGPDQLTPAELYSFFMTVADRVLVNPTNYEGELITIRNELVVAQGRLVLRCFEAVGEGRADPSLTQGLDINTAVNAFTTHLGLKSEELARATALRDHLLKDAAAKGGP